MKIRFLLCFFIASPLFQNIYGQGNSLIRKINSLSQVTDIPFDSCQLLGKDCGNNVIWEIVKYGKPAIEPLINKIMDTSYSHFYLITGFNEPARLRTGDIAYIVLQQIIPINNLPKMEEFDTHICGGYPVDLFTHYLKSFSYRRAFQEQIRKDYQKRKFKWIPGNKNELTACEIEHGITGHYRE